MADSVSSPGRYGNRRYLNLLRVITHWAQADAVARVCPEGGAVLEVGVGSGHVAWLLGQWGYELTTLDIEPDLRPDIVADVCAIPLDDGAVDCALAAEVLEHIPFERFAPALRELARVSRAAVVVTLPAPLVGLSMLVNLPKIEPKQLTLGLPYRATHAPGGEHCWELGKKGFSLARIRNEIRSAGLAIQREFRPAPSLFCRGFVLRKT